VVGSPNIDAKAIETAITRRTKAVCIVHYAGEPCDIGAISRLCHDRGIPLLEDAAQAIGSTYEGAPLGSFGVLSAFSFHETKNVGCGEGGLLVVNDESYWQRAEIVRQNGTDRSRFHRGEIAKYGWVDVGSSYLMSDVLAGFLYCQLLVVDEITRKRKRLCERYYRALAALEELGHLRRCRLTEQGNGHTFYVLVDCEHTLGRLRAHLRARSILACTHYVPLHTSSYYLQNFGGVSLPNAESFGRKLLRLPLFYDLSPGEQDWVVDGVREFFLDLPALQAPDGGPKSPTSAD
jgi:dTDP-4-amino-4,6-dideoxygalactose transaminase